MTTTEPALRVMVDANILIAGSLWPRWPYEILLHAISEDFRLVLSPYIIAQAQRQVARSFPEGAWRLERMLELLDYELVDDPSEREVAQAAGLVRDPTDIPVALAAIRAKVDYLVSEDKDLAAQDKTTEQLRKRLSVPISGTFLREVMGWRSEDLERVRKRTWKDLKGEEEQ